MLIYKATNKMNGKIYIGQTVQELWARKAGHKFHSNVKDNIFSRAIRKYGFENFDWEIIDQAESKEELNEKEIYWIAHFNSHGISGYNETDGGEGSSGYTMKLETKSKISQTRIQRINEYSYSKLNTENVTEIKILLMSELYTQKEIADMFFVTKNTINNIKCQARWAHVSVEGFNEWSTSTNGRRLSLDNNKPNNKVKLNKEKVIEIKKLLLKGELNHPQIAQLYGVTVSTIEYIKYGRTWKHVVVDS